MTASFAADVLLKATLLLVLVAVVAHVLRRRSAALRHLLWTLAIVGIAALPLFTALAPFRLPILPSGVGSRPHEPRDRAPARSDPPPTAPPRVSFASDPTTPDVATPSASAADLPPIDPTRVLLIVWSLGALVLLARFAVGLTIVRGVTRRAREVEDETWLALADRAARSLGVVSHVTLRRTDEVAMPFAAGLVRPSIVLPSSSNDWGVERREAVLMHEFAHISRGDLAMNILSHFVRALYWFHPLAWLAAHRLRVEGERACDDAVLRAGTMPSDYAEHLLSIVRTVGSTVPTAALAMARRSDFEGRLLAILEPGIPRARMTRWRAAGMAALFLVVVMPLAAMSPTMGSGVAQAQVTPAAQGSEATTTVDALIQTLGDASVSVRIAAINSLGNLKEPKAIAALVKALREDSDPRVREAAAWALGEIDDSRAVAPLIEALKSERVPSVKEKIIRALGEIDDPAAVGGITAVLKDPSVNVRRAAVWALGELEDPSAASALLGMVKDDDVEVRQHTAQALGELKSIAAIDALSQLSKDDNADVRVQAVEALGQLEDIRALATLVAALKDPNAEVRSQAADAIQQLEGVKKAPPALIDLLSDPNREVRRNAAQALGDIGDPAAVPGLKRLTSDGDAETRHAAAEALSDIGGPEALQALMGLLKDQDPEIRRIAAEALGSKRH